LPLFSETAVQKQLEEKGRIAAQATQSRGLSQYPIKPLRVKPLRPARRAS
jgi:hypothetical protein